MSVLGAAAAGLAGCASSSAPGTAGRSVAKPGLSSAADTAPAPAACSRSDLPAGFTLDPQHSGKLTATNYSQSADVQAALEYDGLRGGERQVFLRRNGSRIDAVASCVSLTFPTAAGATRFFESYRYLRKEAGKLAVREPLGRQVAGLSGTVAYLERKQSFNGYGIASTNVLEAAGLHGTTLEIASLSGSTPSKPAVAELLSALAGGAR